MASLSWDNHVAAKIARVACDMHVTADILRVTANILRVTAGKVVEEAKICWPKKFFFTFLKIFLSFLGFSRVKIHFFQKVL